MSLIKVDIDNVRSVASSSLISVDISMSRIKTGVSSVRNSVDNKILSRRNIGGRLTNALHSLDEIDAKLKRLRSTIDQCMNYYSEAEQKILLKSIAWAESI